MSEEQAAAGVVEFSLADLADVDVSAIQEVRYETLAQGSFEFEVTESDMAETVKDNAKVFIAEAKLTVVECFSVLEPGIDRESLVGKTTNQTQRINMADVESRADLEKQIGRIKAMVTDMGGDNTANIIESVRNLKGNRFRAQVSHGTSKTDPSVKFVRLKFPKAA